VPDAAKVEELVAWAKREFPNSKLSEAEIERLARLIVQQLKTDAAA